VASFHGLRCGDQNADEGQKADYVPSVASWSQSRDSSRWDGGQACGALDHGIEPGNAGLVVVVIICHSAS